MFNLVPFRHCILKVQALARIISGAVTEDNLLSKLLRTERKEGKATGPGCQSSQMSIPVKVEWHQKLGSSR